MTETVAMETFVQIHVFFLSELLPIIKKKKQIRDLVSSYDYSRKKPRSRNTNEKKKPRKGFACCFLRLERNCNSQWWSRWPSSRNSWINSDRLLSQSRCHSPIRPNRSLEDWLTGTPIVILWERLERWRECEFWKGNTIHIYTESTQPRRFKPRIWINES